MLIWTIFNSVKCISLTFLQSKMPSLKKTTWLNTQEGFIIEQTEQNKNTKLNNHRHRNRQSCLLLRMKTNMQELWQTGNKILKWVRKVSLFLDYISIILVNPLHIGSKSYLFSRFRKPFMYTVSLNFLLQLFFLSKHMQPYQLILCYLFLLMCK